MSAVIVTLLLVMLSIVLIGIVYVVISNIVKSGTEQTSFQFGTLFLDLSLSKVSVNSATGDVTVTVKRSPGGDASLNLSGIAFVFSDGINSITVKKNAYISPLGSRTFTFTPADLSGIYFVKEVEIAPIITTNNKAQIGREVDSSSEEYYNSCKTILKAGASSGDGIYTIDTDGLGPIQPIKVYCDMTTDGGGWTLVGRSDPTGSWDWGCNGDTSPSGTSFGWKADSGSVSDDNSHYSLNVSKYKLNFTQILFGSYTTGKTWGSYVYTQTVSPTFLSDYATDQYYIGNPTPLTGGNTGFGMAGNIGFTNNPDIFHWRDVAGSGGNGFGLASNGWDTCYGTQASLAAWGGNINTYPGMVMVR